MALLLAVALILLAAPAWATEAICPGGASERADISWCADFETLDNCTTGHGKDAQCWQDNGYGDSPGQTIFNPEIVSGDAAVGSGYLKLRAQPGSTANIIAIKSNPQGFPSSKMAYRYYIRFARGYTTLGNTSGHGVQMEAWGTNGCFSALKYQLPTQLGYVYYPAACGATSMNLYANQPASPVRYNNRWYAVEVQAAMDDSWTPRLNLTGAYSMQASDHTIRRTSGSFIDDGWVVNMHVQTSGFGNAQNNHTWNIDGVQAQQMTLTRQTSSMPEQVDEACDACSRTLKSIEADDANGSLRVWLDGTLILKYTTVNFGGVTNGLQWGTQFWAPENYYHYGVPAWGFEIDWDNFVLSNMSGITPSDTPPIGAAASPNATGTADASSPYRNMIPYGAWLGRHAGLDCTTRSTVGEYLTVQWRGDNAVLQSATTHGRFLDSCANTVAWRNAQMGAPPVGALFWVTDAADATDCTSGGGDGSFQHNCRYNGATWVFESATDAALQATVPGNSGGAGAYYERGDTYSFPQYVSYGWIYLPHACGSGTCNTYAGMSNLVLSGFANDRSGPTNGYVGLSIDGSGNWAVRERDASNNTDIHSTSAVVTFDAWHEYELILWKETGGDGKGRVSLMIDRARVLTQTELTHSAAWAFTGAFPIVVVGVLDFQGTGPFTAYFDDSVATSASAWSCDGWATASCPFATGVQLGAGLRLGAGVGVR